MTRDQVDETLKIYRATEARVAYLRSQLEILQEYLRKNENSVVNDGVSLSQAITGMPHGSGVGDPVGNLALRIAMGKTSVFVQQVRKEIEPVERELRLKQYILSFTDAWLMALNEREEKIVTLKMIDGKSWAEILTALNSGGGPRWSKHTIQRIFDNGMEKVYEAAK